MSDDPEWFAPKRYGYGAGMPIRWQGWALTILFAVAMLAATLLFKYSAIAFISVATILVVALIAITARTTRGGWRWRWGDDDQVR